jgi:putative glutamine amidotransferase
MKRVFFVLLIVIALFSCDRAVKTELRTVRIAISKEKREGVLENYHNWLLRYDRHVTWVNLYGMPVDSALSVAAGCNAVLITGGEDVYPGIYGKIADTARCGRFDRYRDTLEIALIKQAVENRQPLFGVCRGEQIINVALGGTLIIDIPTDFGTTVIHRQKDWKHCYHPVYLNKSSLLYEVSKVDRDTVASNHHQGIEIPGKNLLVSARAADSLPEAVEWLNGNRKGFLMAVQWHPERMPVNHPLSKPPALLFLNSAKKYFPGRKK